MCFQKSIGLDETHVLCSLFVSLFWENRCLMWIPCRVGVVILDLGWLTCCPKWHAGRFSWHLASAAVPFAFLANLDMLWGIYAFIHICVCVCVKAKRLHLIFITTKWVLEDCIICPCNLRAETNIFVFGAVFSIMSSFRATEHIYAGTRMQDRFLSPPLSWLPGGALLLYLPAPAPSHCFCWRHFTEVPTVIISHL